MLSLREIGEDNFFDCLNLDPALSENYVDPVVFSLAEAWLHQNFRPWAVYQEDALVGFVSFYVGEEHYQITNFLIDQAHQGRGLGKEAAQVCIAYLKKHYGAKQVSLPVQPDNHKAYRFWEGVGFKASDVIEDGYVFMRLTL